MVVSATKQFLDFVGVVASILLAQGGDLVHLLGSNIADLVSLGIDNLGGVVDLRIDELLVGSINQGHEEDDGGADNGKAPVGNELDQEVGDESSDASLSQVRFLLSPGVE